MQLKTVFLFLVVVSAVSVTEGHWWGNYGGGSWWQRLLCSGWFNWAWNGNAYMSERISEMRPIVGQCRADVGRCPVGSCTTKMYYFCPHDGYICPETETREIDCGFATKKYEYVTKCVCCEDNGIVVQGVVLDAVTNAPLDNIEILFNGTRVTYSVGDGKFKSTIKSSIRSLVVRAKDTDNNYMDAVKNVDIPEGFRGPVEVKMFMIKKADPVKIDSMVYTVLSLSNDPLDSTTGNTVIEIKANSFKKRNGGRYNGEVNVSVTFIDTPRESEDIIPGRFLTPRRNGLKPLITDGIVSFSFKSVDGKDLTLFKPVKFSMREGMKVWVLNTVTGFWEPAWKSPRRGKRQVSLDDIINIESDRWYNIDKIPGAPRCYFKGRIFNKTDGAEITSSDTASFRPQITAYTYLQQRLRLYAGYTSTPNTTCYEVRCPEVANPNNSLAGFINMSATEVISVGGIQLSSITYLTPRELNGYNNPIQSAHSGVQYTVAPNGLDVFINFVGESTGPFYINKDTCESSTVSQPAFHFFKPEPPSYLPVPNDTEICTARIAFRDNWNFYNYTANSTNLPNVTGISVWEQDGSDFYFTDVAQMKHVSAGNESFVFICLKYRCSQANESTTVYLDIDIPTVNVTYNYTTENGSVMNYTYTMQNFYCRGARAEGAEFANGGKTSIEGSFIPPENVGSGPVYYDTETNDCKLETDSETFAYAFFCSRRVSRGKEILFA